MRSLIVGIAVVAAALAFAQRQARGDGGPAGCPSLPGGGPAPNSPGGGPPEGVYAGPSPRDRWILANPYSLPAPADYVLAPPAAAPPVVPGFPSAYPYRGPYPGRALTVAHGSFPAPPPDIGNGAVFDPAASWPASFRYASPPYFTSPYYYGLQTGYAFPYYHSYPGSYAGPSR